MFALCANQGLASSKICKTTDCCYWFLVNTYKAFIMVFNKC